MLPNSKWPLFDKKISAEASNILKSGKVNYWTGNNGKLFEKEFSKFFHINHSYAVSNGSIGLEIALLALGIKNNDEVIVTSRSYYSSVSSILRVNAKPVFADIDLETFNISISSIIKKITKKTKVIICVHLYGMPCNMLELKKIIKGTNIKIIEDCSQAHGASIKNQKVGSFGDIGVWSFCNDKIISTGGEGGMIATNSKYLAKKIWTLKEIGKDFDKTTKIKKSNNFPYIHDNIGTNARMTEIQSAIGRYQLKNLNYFIKKRNINAKFLNQKLSKFKSLKLPKIPNNYKHAFYRYVITLNPSNIKTTFSRSKIMDLIYKEKIFCNVGGCPAIYKELYFKKNNFVPKNKLHNTEFISDKTISFQIDHTITKKNLLEMSKKLQQIFNKVTK